MDAESVGRYRIFMDGQWRLDDLYQFPHAFAQIYSFLYAFGGEGRARNDERIDDALSEYPWRGGYSVVNIYTVLGNQVWPQDRPIIKEIRYASPGWIDLALVSVVAFQAAQIIASIAKFGVSAAKLYSKLQATIAKIREHQQDKRIRELRLASEELAAVRDLTEKLAAEIGFERLGALNERTGDLVVSAQLVCSLYRRGKALSGYLKDGKAALPLDEHGTLPTPPDPSPSHSTRRGRLTRKRRRMQKRN